MKKLPYTLMVVCLALIVLNIFVLRHLDKLERRIIQLEQTNGLRASPVPPK